ncbi:MAG: hypothetical protein Q9196_005758, partial [Gyalolechia fulgens]
APQDRLARSLVRFTSTTRPAPPAHHDLPSFLAYARSAALSPTSSLYVGTYYEYLCLATLRRLSFTLTRTGGRSDRGIDLLGHWHLPSIPEPLRVLVQCKAQNSSLTPSLVRELAGIYAGAPAGWRNDGADGKTVAMLCGKKAATAGARDALRSCKVPVVWVAIEDSGTDGLGKVKQVLWNQRVNELGAEGVGVGLRYMPGGRPGFELEKEVVLTWQGKVWEPDWNGKSKGMKRGGHVDADSVRAKERRSSV